MNQYYKTILISLYDCLAKYKVHTKISWKEFVYKLVTISSIFNTRNHSIKVCVRICILCLRIQMAASQLDWKISQTLLLSVGYISNYYFKGRGLES